MGFNVVAYLEKPIASSAQNIRLLRDYELVDSVCVSTTFDNEIGVGAIPKSGERHISVLYGDPEEVLPYPFMELYQRLPVYSSRSFRLGIAPAIFAEMIVKCRR